MFHRKDKEKVVELTGVPQPNAGASLPVIFCDEFQLKLAYLVHKTDNESIDDAAAVTVNQDSASKELIIIEFSSFCVYSFGIPNHRPINKQQFENTIYPLGIFRIENSSWISALEKEESSSLTFTRKRVLSCQHFIIYFQNSTFECIAEDFEIRREQNTISNIGAQFIKTMIS